MRPNIIYFSAVAWHTLVKHANVTISKTLSKISLLLLTKYNIDYNSLIINNTAISQVQDWLSELPKNPEFALVVEDIDPMQVDEPVWKTRTHWDT